MDAMKCEHCGLEIHEWVEFCTGCGEPLEGYRKPAGFWIRVGASIIDWVVFIPVMALSIWNTYHLKNVALLVGLGIVGLLYKPLMEAFYGATLGKMAVGIKVIDGQGRKLSVVNAYVRFLPFLALSAVSLVAQVIMFQSEGFLEARSYMEMAQVQQNQNAFLQAVTLLLSLVVLVDCICVAFTRRKRALHDMMAESYCVYKGPGD